MLCPLILLCYAALSLSLSLSLFMFMTPYYLSQIFPYPPTEGDQAQSQLHPSTQANDPTCKFPFPILFNTTQDQEVIHGDHASQQQLLLHPKPFSLLLMGAEQSENYSYNDHNTMDQTMCDPCLGEDDPVQGSSKWMSSKMRIMKKMLKYSDRIVVPKPREQSVQEIHDQQQSNKESSSSTTTNPGGIIRVCSDCNTTKTPLWRSGPRGPKSLCNACGIRQRKARRAMAAAAAAALGGGGGLVSPASAQRKVRKDKRPDVDCSMPFKKRCRFSNAGDARKKLRFDETGMHRAGFPQDERDAAILLMTLSCGLINS